MSDLRTGRIAPASIVGYWVREDESSYDPMWLWRPTFRSAVRLSRRLRAAKP